MNLKEEVLRLIEKSKQKYSAKKKVEKENSAEKGGEKRLFGLRRTRYGR